MDEKTPKISDANTMPEIYQINGLWSFSPDAKLLKNIKDNRSASLHAPASNCLLALIARQGDIISQEELYNIGWGEIKGPSTSPSAYYQCFVNLRKQLKTIGYEDELVITVPKKGVKLSPTAEVITIQEVPSTAAGAHQRMASSWLKKNKLLATVIAGLCVVLMALVLISVHRHEYVSQRFHTLKELPECLFIKKSDDMSMSEAVDTVQSQHIVCRSEQPVYVSVSHGKLTGIQCDNELRRCQSFTWIYHYE